MSNLKDHLIRLGFQAQNLRPHLTPVLEHLDREIVSSSTNWYDRNSSVRDIRSYQDPLAIERAIEDMDNKEILTRWAILRNEPVEVSDILRFFKSQAGMEPRDPRPKEFRRQKGDRVFFEASSCKDEQAMPLAREYDGKKGTIVETHKTDSDLKVGKYGDVMIQVDGGPLIRYPHAQKSKSIGIKTPKTGKGILIETVYDKMAGGSPASKADIELATNYVGRAVGDEMRSLKYHAGPAKGIGIGQKDGKLYFRMLDSTRGGRYTTVSEKGTIYYVGIAGAGNRPQGMKEDLFKARMRALEGGNH